MGNYRPQTRLKIKGKPRIHVLADLRPAPFGGGAQFLSALSNEFLKQGMLEEKLRLADVVLFNSHHLPFEVLWARCSNLSAVFAHRVDGPMLKYTDTQDIRDLIVFEVNRTAADCTVFQSHWSRKENLALGATKSRKSTVILNGADSGIFRQINVDRRLSKDREKVRLVAASWSANPKKGFKAYEFIDQHLDFSKYSMTFVGNCPIDFENIKQIPPVGSAELATIFGEHDIFLTASEGDPCSNVLIEAQLCGLPALVLNDGGHPEIIGSGGVTFNSYHELIEKLDYLADNLERYSKKIKERKVSDVAKRYIEFFDEVEPRRRGRYTYKQVLGSVARIFCMRVRNRLEKTPGR